MSEPYVVCKQVVRAYRVGDHELVALRGIDFQMARGEMVAINGPSGAGKSSLLNLIGGLDRPTAGRLTVGGLNLLELRGRALATYRLRQVGFVWQQAERNLLPRRSAQRNITLPLLLAGMPPGKRRQRSLELMEAVGIRPQARQFPATLSGGQQQRVALAVALANHPDLLLADEPTGALDHQSAIQMMNLLCDLRKRYGLTVLMVTHDIEMAGFADRILTLRDGALGQDVADADQAAPQLDSSGRIQLPAAVRAHLNDGSRITVEIRPEGVLLRPEQDETEDVDAALKAVLPQDAPPAQRRRLGWLRRIRRREVHT